VKSLPHLNSREYSSPQADPATKKKMVKSSISNLFFANLAKDIFDISCGRISRLQRKKSELTLIGLSS
jgi:hypothetical protein